MIDQYKLKALLSQHESSNLDYKREHYRLDNDHFKSEFLKDILAMANTPREGAAYIIIGVKAYPDGKKDFVGVTNHPDDTELHDKFSNKQAKIEPRPTFLYQPIALDEKTLGVIEIPLKKDGPFYPTGDFGVLKAHRLYFRDGTQNREATIAEKRQIHRWFDEPEGKRLPYFNATLQDSAEELFNRQLNNFTSPLIEKIKSRGYWQVSIHPTSFSKEHFSNLTGLYPLLRDNLVTLSGWGWDFPHLEPAPPQLDLDSISQETNQIAMLGIAEAWRFYQSGQLIYYASDAQIGKKSLVGRCEEV